MEILAAAASCTAPSRVVEHLAPAETYVAPVVDNFVHSSLASRGESRTCYVVHCSYASRGVPHTAESYIVPAPSSISCADPALSLSASRLRQLGTQQVKYMALAPVVSIGPVSVVEDSATQL